MTMDQINWAPGPPGEATRPITRPTLRPPTVSPGPPPEAADPWRQKPPSDASWRLPTFRRIHRTLDRRTFCRAYPCPLLIVRWLPGHTPDARGAVTPRSATIRTAMRIFPLARRGLHALELVTLGRAEDNDLVIDHHAVSKCHALFREDDGWTLTDAGSTNGTRLDGSPVRPRRPIVVRDGSLIEIGGVLEVELLASGTVHERYLAD